MPREIIIKNQADLDAISDLEVIESLIVWDTEIEEINLPRLGKIDGGLSLHGNANLASIAMPGLVETRWAMMANNCALSTIAMPALVRARDSISVAYCSLLPSLTMPALVEVGSLVVVGNSVLSTLELPVLRDIRNIQIRQNLILKPQNINISDDTGLKIRRIH